MLGSFYKCIYSLWIFSYEHGMLLAANDLTDKAQDRFFCILPTNSILFRLNKILLDGLCILMLLVCFWIPCFSSSLFSIVNLWFWVQIWCCLLQLRIKQQLHLLKPNRLLQTYFHHFVFYLVNCPAKYKYSCDLFITNHKK